MSITIRDNKVYSSDSGMLAGEIVTQTMTGDVFYRHVSPNGLFINEIEDILTLMRSRVIENRTPAEKGLK